MAGLAVRDSRYLSLSLRGVQGLLLAAALGVDTAPAMVAVLAAALLGLPLAIRQVDPRGCTLECAGAGDWYLRDRGNRRRCQVTVCARPPVFVWLKLEPESRCGVGPRQLLVFCDALPEHDYRALRRQLRVAVTVN